MKPSLTTLAALTSAALIPSASAVGLIGLFDVGATQQLGLFDSDSPGTVANQAITGPAASESLTSIDYRPATNQIYAIANGTGNVFTLTTSGASTLVGNYVTGSAAGSSMGSVPGNNFGFDFNPAFMGGQFARIISNDRDNRVISGDTGAYLGGDKTDVFYAAGDAFVNMNTPQVSHIAYTNSGGGVPSGTQQYGIDVVNANLVTVANNAGTLETVGTGGQLTGVTAIGGFDIVGNNNLALAGFATPGGDSTLYNINLTDGTSTSLGQIGMAGTQIRGLAAVPEPSTSLFALLGGLALLRRKRQ